MFQASLLCASALVASSQGPRDYAEYTFDIFLAEYGRSYQGGEHSGRKQQFAKNLEEIRAHNAEFAAGRRSWWMGVNRFADWSEQEFRAMHGRRGPRIEEVMPGAAGTGLRSLPKHQLPTSVDWREKGMVTPVKDQKLCGSCWAISATQSVESAFAIATNGTLLELAPQTYVSCMQNPQMCGGKGGCEGAIPELAFNYTAKNGIPAEKDYPYQAGDSPCLVDVPDRHIEPAVFVDGYVKLPANDAAALETALATIGPVSVSVAAGSMMKYAGGIFDGCADVTIDHSVQAVGYAQDYWLIRNSWGAAWGESGYIRLSRDKDHQTVTDTDPAMGFACKPYPKSVTVSGECGILSDSCYPTGARAAPPPGPPSPPTPPPTKVCHAMDPSQGQVTDEWCTQNCNAGWCPVNLCYCDDGRWLML